MASSGLAHQRVQRCFLTVLWVSGVEGLLGTESPDTAEQIGANGASGSSRCSWTVRGPRSVVLVGKHIAIWDWWFLLVVPSRSTATLNIAVLVLWGGPWRKVDKVLLSETLNQP